MSFVSLPFCVLPPYKTHYSDTSLTFPSIPAKLGLPSVLGWLVRWTPSPAGRFHPDDPGSNATRSVQPSPSPFPFQSRPLPAPWRALHLYPSIDSTQDEARRRHAAGQPLAGMVFLAEEQTRGRGRSDRAWHSGPGGLYVTAALPLPMRLPPGYHGWLPLLGALACAETLDEIHGLQTRIKWPNDLFRGEAKLAGLLGDCLGDGYLIGMGLNWANEIEPAALAGRFPATCLAQHARAPLEGRLPFLLHWLDRVQLLQRRLIDDLEAAVDHLAARAEAALWGRARRVHFEQTELGPVAGELLGLTRRAAARVRVAPGRVVELHCGHQTPATGDDPLYDHIEVLA